MDQEKNNKRKIILLRSGRPQGIIRPGLIRAKASIGKEVIYA